MNEIEACPRCGAALVASVGTPGVLMCCETCDFRLEGCGDPALPEWKPDFHEAVLILDSVGPSPTRVASLIRASSRLSPQDALALIHSERSEILRRPAFDVREVEALQQQLTTLGAACTIHRIA